MSCDPPATPMPPRSSLLDVFVEGMNLPTSSMFPSYSVQTWMVGMLRSQSTCRKDPSSRMTITMTWMATPILVMSREGLVYSWHSHVLSWLKK